METPSERRSRRRDQPATVKVGRTARTFVHATHPDTGLDVVFLPGELLPDWLELDSAAEAW
jgi:hypothetical protein